MFSRMTSCEKLPPVPRVIPNLSERKLRLQHREPVAIAGLSVGHRIGVRQRCEPFAEKSLDLPFIESLRDALRRRRVPTAQEPVVERFEFDAPPGQLPLEILVPVEAELARVGKVGAELDEEGSEVFVHAVKIIVVYHGRGVVNPRDGAPALPEALADGARHASLLLGDADKEDTLPRFELPQPLVHDIVFAHPFLKADNRGRLSLHEVEHLAAKPFAQGHRFLGRSEPVALVAAEIGCHSRCARQLRHIEVQIHAVDAFQLKDDIFTLEFRDVFWQSHGGVWLSIC